MQKIDNQERRLQRRQQVAELRQRQVKERQESWVRRNNNRIFSFRVRRCDVVVLNFDFSKVVLVEFDPGIDNVDSVPARVRHQKHLTSQATIMKTN